ncbi:virulence-associated E family protein [Sinorhizobium meliloti]|uniref:virulence-associated E family protein n=1 Tax=Rhizobium meliloti TaxID=382 RepID=UPI000FD9FDBA|nr:virulence-associated E family protein [Sinorhizobium meliloti]RVL75349.1 virulence-associated E family protein [Sinorhizobium meliloti]
MHDVTKKPRTKKQKVASSPRNGSWTEVLRVDDDGLVILDVGNVVLALYECPSLKGRFSFNEMLRAPMTTFGTGELRPLTDVDVYAVQCDLQWSAMPKISKTSVYDGILLVAEHSKYHPVRDWLGGLKWDGKSRIADWLTYYLGVEKTPYADEIGKLFLIAMVARIFEPGCKADYMMVLEGPQGLLKSSACGVLAGSEYFSDALPDITKDQACSQHLRGKWLIEVAELSSLSKSDSSHLKAFVTRRDERYRPPYGRAEVHEPRQCLFVGTTNSRTYLKDETGARRFWPVMCGTIDLDALRRDRDQLFAEAVARYRRGDKWWPDRDFEREHIRPQQQTRRVSDVWEEPIADYLNGTGDFAGKAKKTATIFDIARHALFIDTPRIGTADQRRIAAILEGGQWVRSKSLDSNGRQTWEREQSTTEHLQSTLL